MRAYLEKYAEPEARLALDGAGRWDEVVALPLYDEEALVEDCLASLAATGRRPLVIAVVNGREALPGNLRTLEMLGARGPLTLVNRDGLDLLVVDRASRDFFPADQGVGLARKIGCDLALRLKVDGRVAADFVHTTDADARVAADYFDCAPRGEARGLGREVAAWIHPFVHDLEEDAHLPLRLYEISLRYYVLGLEWAKSPYAFHTIGSTMAIGFQAYANVRGFPRREAAEDFYLLAKLAKVGAIVTGGGAITLVPRPSARVPFGTGRSMSKIADELAGGVEYALYAPETFTALRDWLAAVESFATTRDVRVLDVRHVPAGAEDAARTALATRKDPPGLRRHLHTWFDGFRTLKFIHTLRDAHYPSVRWSEALARAPWATDEREPRAALARMRALEAR